MTLTYFKITGSLSLGFSIFTFLMIILRKLVTKRKIPWIVVYITFSDMITTIGYLLGTPVDHTYRCTIQGYITTTFPICSVCWTTLAAWKLYKCCNAPNLTPITTANSGKKSKQIPFIMWLFCLFYGILPLTTSRYGCSDAHSSCWCYVTHHDDRSYSSIWTPVWYYSFYIILWISFFVYLLLGIYILSYLHSNDQTIRSFFFSPKVYQLAGYPLILIICWLPISIVEILSWNETKGFDQLAYVCVGLQGTLASIVYLLTNTSHWRCCHPKKAQISQELAPLPKPEPKVYEIPTEMAPTRLVCPVKYEVQDLKLEDYSPSF